MLADHFSSPRPALRRTLDGPTRAAWAGSLAAAVALVAGGPASAAPAALQTGSAPLAHLVYFRADWCSVCTLVDPRIAEVRAAFAEDPRLSVIEVDFSAADADYDAMIDAIVDANLVDVYNGYFMMTGFGVVSSAARPGRAACLTRAHTAEAMTSVVVGLLDTLGRAEAAPLDEDLLCPAPRQTPATP